MMQYNGAEIQRRLIQNRTMQNDEFAAFTIWQIGGPFLFLGGSALNFLAIIIFLHRRNRGHSIFLFLTALSCADLVGLWTNFTQRWFLQQHEIYVETYSVFGCKFHVFLARVALQCSSWLLMALSTERVVTVLFPVRSKVIFSLVNTYIIIGTIVSTFFLLNINVFRDYNIRVYYYDNATYKYTCENLVNFDAVLEHGELYCWLDLWLIYIFPFAYLSLSNIALFLTKSKRKLEILSSSITKKEESVLKLNEFRQLTSIVVRLNILFIFITIPSRSYSIVYANADLNKKLGRKIILMAVFFLLSFLNNVLNFVMYYISSSKFRKDVREIIIERQLNWFF